MPDILGPDLYLCIYLLVFARDTLSPIQRWAVYVLSWWAITSHSSHLLVALGLCAFLTLLASVTSNLVRRNLTPAIELTAVIALAVGAQTALNAFLYGKPSLSGDRPPFLTARVIADGPGRWYLQNHCATAEWEICNYAKSLPQDLEGSSNWILWDPNGVWMRATMDARERLLRQDAPFAVAAFRAYPREQIEKAASNFWMQIVSFQLEDLKRHTVVMDHIGEVLPRERLSYLQSRQARNQLPNRLFTSILYCAVALSLLAIAAFAVWSRKTYPPRLLRLGLVIFSVVTINAFVTGTLSTVNSRYECRVIWLVPLFAGLCVSDWQARHSAKPALRMRS
ncbi:MAG TPA: hypothetical protein VHZ28_01940 [Terracidiphilus sp.]|nr:hypothetical protein [Terracidiphilus sp.]